MVAIVTKEAINDTNGRPLANGSLTFHLNNQGKPEENSDPATQPVRMPLDGDGKFAVQLFLHGCDDFESGPSNYEVTATSRAGIAVKKDVPVRIVPNEEGIFNISRPLNFYRSIP